MTSLNPNNNDLKQFPLLSFVVPYALATSLLYLFGYWSSFQINILEYVSLPDVIKLAIYPLVIGAFLSLVGFYVQVIVGTSFTADPEKAFIVVSRKYVGWTNWIVFFLILGILFFKRTGSWYVTAGFLLAFLVSFNFLGTDKLKNYIPHPSARKVILFSVSIILFTSYGRGKENAERILNGTRYKTVSTSVFKEKGSAGFDDKKLLEGLDKLKYIGTAGDYFFFISMDNSRTFVAKYSDFHFIEFENH
jgi:hypothetical protein